MVGSISAGRLQEADIRYELCKKMGYLPKM